MALVVIVIAAVVLLAGLAVVTAVPRVRARLRGEPVWWQDFEQRFRQYVAEQERSAR
jgi:hypothetical protein